MKTIKFLLFSMIICLLLAQSAFPASGRNANILVYPFEYNGDSKYSWISSGLTDTVISDLGRIKGINVFSDDDRKRTIKEMELGMTGLFNESTVVKVGNVMGANIIFLGSLQVAGDKIRVNAKLVNVETSKIEKTIKIDGTMDQIFELQDKVVLGLLAETEKVNIADVKPVVVDDKDKSRITNKYKPGKDAYELYANGLRIMGSDPKGALDYFNKAINISPEYTAALSMAGVVSGSTLTRFKEGLEYMTAAEKVLISRGDEKTDEYAALMINTGIVYNSKGEPDRALEYYDRAEKIMINLNRQESATYASLMTGICNAYIAKNSHDRALEFCSKSREIRERLKMQNSSAYATLMVNIGIIYKAKGDFDRSLDYYSKSEALMGKLGMNGTTAYATLMMDEGNVYYSKKDFDKSLEYYNKSGEVRDKLGLHDSAGYADLLNNIGLVYYAKGDFDRALENYSKAVEKKEKLGVQKSVGYGNILFNTAVIYHKKGNSKMAGEYYRKSSEIYKSCGLNSKAENALKKAKELGF